MKLLRAKTYKFTLILIISTMAACTENRITGPIDPTLPERVGLAEAEKVKDLEKILDAYNARLGDPVFIRAFKHEELLEVWVQSGENKRFIKVKAYPICAASGKPGPKLREGDKQVPEGFYHIGVFNPLSSFHLSLGLNYPNASDRYFSDSEKPGGDIYIHGSCMSIGCLAMTDDSIKEIYVFCDRARRNGQKNIPVHIFPFEFGSKNEEEISQRYPGYNKRWKNLKELDNYFVMTGKLPKWDVDSSGRYILLPN